MSISYLLTQQTSAPPKTSVAAPPSVKAGPETIVEAKATPMATPTATAGASGGLPSLNSDRQQGREEATKEVQKQQSEENRVTTAAATNSPGQQQEVTEGQRNDKDGLDNQELSNKVDKKGREEDSGEGAEVVVEADVVERELSSTPPTSALSNEQQPQQGASNSGDSKASSTTL